MKRGKKNAMKKKLVTVIVLCLLLLFSSCTTEDTTMYDAIRYVRLMELHNTTGGAWMSYERLKDIGFNQIIFVHSEEEFLTGDFPNDAIVAWPSMNAHLRLNGLNTWIKENENEINLRRHSLTYPLTMIDMIDNWKSILDLIRRNQTVGDSPWRDVQDEFDRIMSLEERILSEAFAEADFDPAEYGLELPINASNVMARNPETSRWIIFELYDMLDEDVQLRLLTEIPHLMALYRDEQRRFKWQARRLAMQEAYDNAE